MIKWLILFMVIVISSCTKEYGYEVDAELQPYFETFELEGSLRGFDIDIDAEGIGGMIEFIKDNSTVGQCQTSDEGNRRVFIDKAFWQAYNNSEKEFIVFHELGHCYLRREHDDSIDNNRVCKSIMQSGLSGCKNNYDASTREAYLDELFKK